MRLSGKQAICQFVGRGWATVEQWILDEGFPAKKIMGVWESDSDWISQWREERIVNPDKPPKLIKSRGKYRKSEKVKTQ